MVFACFVQTFECVVFFAACFNLIYLVNAVGEFPQIFSREKHVVVVGFLDCRRKILRGDIPCSFVYENDGVPDGRELIFPVDVHQRNALFVALDGDAAGFA